MPAVRMEEVITVRYCKQSDGKMRTAVFDNLEDAQLWWDSIVYLRNVYCVADHRPGYKPDAQLAEWET